jgi:hypothetical protein
MIPVGVRHKSGLAGGAFIFGHVYVVLLPTYISGEGKTMETIEQLESKRQKILQELGELRAIRRGTISQQFVDTIDKEGRPKRRGPYFLHTYKDKGKTISRRLTSTRQVERCQAQIEAYRRYEQLTTQLLEIGEQISNLTLSGEVEKKTSRCISKSSKTPK